MLHKFRIPVAILIILACAGVSILLAVGYGRPTSRSFLIRARQYAYDPPIININRGDTVHIKLTTMDVVHGFFLEGHGINVHIYPSPPVMHLQDPTQKEGFRPVDEVVFIAEKVGKFRYRCSHTCGSLHPFMQGEMIVGPNYPYYASIGAAAGVFLSAFFLLFTRKSRWKSGG